MKQIKVKRICTESLISNKWQSKIKKEYYENNKERLQE